MLKLIVMIISSSNHTNQLNCTLLLISEDSGNHISAFPIFVGYSFYFSVITY